MGTILDLDGIRRLVSINTNLFIRTMALLFAFGFLTAQGARMGKTVLAANAILLNFQYFMAYALDGLANAAEALVGKAIGEKSRVGLKRSVLVSIQWSAIVAVAFSVVYGLGGRSIVALLTSLEEVRNVAWVFLGWMVLSPVVSVWSFAFDGIFVGATRAREMRNAMLLCTLGVFIPAWYLLRPLGNHGLWLSFTLFMAARGITLFWRYRADHEEWIAE
jgi:MATE family multidrug resistance protein